MNHTAQVRVKRKGDPSPLETSMETVLSAEPVRTRIHPEKILMLH
jgi:hypothetical protein